MTNKFNEPTLPKAATPLERAIYEFEVKCDNYFKGTNRIPNKETESEKKKRLQDWAKARKHLNDQRLTLNSLVKLEAELKKYRKELGFCTTSEFVEKATKEKHHPTAKLVANLYANGEPKPSTEHRPHHIIPGKGRWLKDELIQTRLLMHLSGIRINDPKNGVWLPKGKKNETHWATPERPNHGALHGKNYEKWLTVELNTKIHGKPFENQLNKIKSGIKTGLYNVKIVEPKDESWNGRD